MEVMLLQNRENLDQLIHLINSNECHLALSTWFDYRHQVEHSCTPCPYGNTQAEDKCGPCLEAKLRTLSLYEHILEDDTPPVLRAARKLEAFAEDNAA